MSWDAKDVALLKELWSVGQSAAQIARRLEQFSVDVNRNSKGVPKSAQIRFGLL